jgi:hypothetical protein
MSTGAAVILASVAVSLGVVLFYFTPRQVRRHGDRARGSFGGELTQAVISTLGYFALLGGFALSGSTGGPLIGGYMPDLALG